MHDKALEAECGRANLQSQEESAVLLYSKNQLNSKRASAIFHSVSPFDSPILFYRLKHTGSPEMDGKPSEHSTYSQISTAAHRPRPSSNTDSSRASSPEKTPPARPGESDFRRRSWTWAKIVSTSAPISSSTWSLTLS